MTITSLVCFKLIINPFNNISNKKIQHQTQVLVENKISCQILVPRLKSLKVFDKKSDNQLSYASDKSIHSIQTQNIKKIK